MQERTTGDIIKIQVSYGIQGVQTAWKKKASDRTFIQAFSEICDEYNHVNT